MTCCSDLPDGKTNLTIVPEVDPDCFGFEEPKDFKDYGCRDFNLDKKDHIDTVDKHYIDGEKVEKHEWKISEEELQNKVCF